MRLRFKEKKFVILLATTVLFSGLQSPHLQSRYCLTNSMHCLSSFAAMLNFLITLLQFLT